MKSTIDMLDLKNITAEKKLDWTELQFKSSQRSWDDILVEKYSDTTCWNSNPNSYWQRLSIECNYLNAIELIEWGKYVGKSCKVADIGCGGGWLTSYLSKFENIDSILAIDSSDHYLFSLLPRVVSLTGGNIEKIIPVKGLFSPLMLDMASLDLIVISSALHHAERMDFVLKEFRRVLKPDGTLLILNENPLSNIRYITKISKAFANIILKTTGKIYNPCVQKVSCAGFLYDPYLGDIIYPEWFWLKCLRATGFDSVQIHKTNLPPVVGSSVYKNGALTHFICRVS